MSTLTDYSDLENEIADAQEPQALPKGTEVEFRIISVNSGISDKNGCRWFNVVMDVPDEPLAKAFSDFFWDLDKTKLDLKQFANNLFKFKTFAGAIDLDYTVPFNWEEDLIGKTGNAILGYKVDDEYGPKNTVSKYVAVR